MSAKTIVGSVLVVATLSYVSDGFSLVPAAVHATPTTDVLGDIASNRILIGFARFTVLVAALFACWSMATMMAKGEYISSIGSLRTSGSGSRPGSTRLEFDQEGTVKRLESLIDEALEKRETERERLRTRG